MLHILLLAGIIGGIGTLTFSLMALASLLGIGYRSSTLSGSAAPSGDCS